MARTKAMPAASAASGERPRREVTPSAEVLEGQVDTEDEELRAGGEADEEDTEDEEYIVEEILQEKVARGKALYLVKWEGFGVGENTWEPAENLKETEA
eukprot:CAMPEP_0119357350 /NCGR_PEP_ID=MMETSP1334-20130426/5763_1 /TAXON_ID=127549 /ORGANISM="Calcidiscus leptoporus, Strain RCC1130" /LENGTH=98 /DNA_ID=CAMNT_0007371571 /DNA_START=30 /DNA_END=323 /DNA_ORIENTATION=+